VCFGYVFDVVGKVGLYFPPPIPADLVLNFWGWEVGGVEVGGVDVMAFWGRGWGVSIAAEDDRNWGSQLGIAGCVLLLLPPPFDLHPALQAKPASGALSTNPRGQNTGQYRQPPTAADATQQPTVFPPAQPHTRGHSLPSPSPNSRKGALLWGWCWCQRRGRG
jgi:hypothetical protein